MSTEREPPIEAEPEAVLEKRTDIESTESETGIGLDENVAGVLTYLLGFVTGIIFYFIETENEFVRFHAVQSTIVFGSLFTVSIVAGLVPILFDSIPIVGLVIALVLGLFSILLGPVVFVLWIVLMYKAYTGKRFRLPVVGKMAEEYV